MTNDMSTTTKAALNALLASPLTASQLKKASHAVLIAMFDAIAGTIAAMLLTGLGRGCRKK